MKNSARSLLIGSLIMTITAAIGVGGYMAAGWSFVDAIFMVVITVFGVGYGEVHDESPGMRVFTIAIILLGCTSLIYLIGGFIQLFTEGELQRVLGKRRMNQEIEKLSQHVIICGLGRIGRLLAADLAKAGVPFVVIETDKDRVAEADAQKYLVLEGDSTDEVILQRAGVTRARLLATVVPNDAANVFITLSARNLNPTLEIIARGEMPSTEAKLFQAGATRVVLPAQIGAERIARQILHPSTEDLLENSDALKNLDGQLRGLGIHIEELEVPEESELIGSNLSKVETESKAPFLVVAINRADGQKLVHGHGDSTT